MLDELDAFVLLREIVDGPFVREEKDKLSVIVGCKTDIGAEIHAFEILWIAVERQPADFRERRILQTAFGGVFRFQTVFYDFELQLPDGTEQNGLLKRSDHLEVLDDAFVEKLLQAVLELLVFGRRGVMQIAEHFRRKTRACIWKARCYANSRTLPAENAGFR